MAQRKTERLLNLFFLLLATGQYLSKDQIRQSIGDYRESTEAAFERNFERDKEELRELGIAVVTGHKDVLFDDEPGYRIHRDDAELPDLSFTREEGAVLGLAAQVWDRTALAGEASAALVKLRSIGIDIDTGALAMSGTHVSASEAAFGDLFDAVHRRVPVEFDYQRPGRERSARRLQPWGLVSRRDRWYVGGLDLDRDAPRVFRLDRIVSAVRPTGRAGSYDVPEGVDVKQIVAMLEPTEAAHRARLRLRHGRGQSLRRRATSVTPGPDANFDELEVPYSSVAAMAAEVIGYGTDVTVLGPDDLRSRVKDTVDEMIRIMA